MIRKFILKLLVVFIIGALLPMVYVYCLPSNPTHYYRAYGIKRNRVKSIKGRKLLIVGMSDTAFGINSTTLEESLHLPVANCGLHGGLGWQFYMQDAVHDAKKGDIIVIFVNIGSKYATPSEISSLIDQYPQEFLSLSLRNKIAALSGLHQLWVNKREYNERVKNGSISIDEQYNVGNFDYHGDDVHHRLDSTQCHRICKWEPMSKSSEELIDFDDFANYVEQLRQKNVTIVLLPRILSTTYYNDNKEVLLWWKDELSIRGCEYATENDAFIFDERYIYNCHGHLNSGGVSLATKKLLKILYPIVRNNV